MPVSAIAVPLGLRLPWFDVLTTDDEHFTTADLVQEHPVVISFLCQHSPYVRLIQHNLGRLSSEYADRATFVGIASNDVRAYPDDDAAHLEAQAVEAGFNFRYCTDVQQRAAKSFRASCTPEFFVFDSAWRLSYHGAYDGSRPGNHIEVTGSELRLALEMVLSSRPRAMRARVNAFGCSIKWTAGHEPPYSFVTAKRNAMSLSAR